jgi:hypothetical protein
MTSTFILGGIVGLLLGLLICYYKQIRLAYENRGLISAGSDLASASQNFITELHKL